MTSNQEEEDVLKPLSAYVGKEMRRDVKILAAKQDTTMHKITQKAFEVGIEILLQDQKDKEAEQAKEVDTNQPGVG